MEKHVGTNITTSVDGDVLTIKIKLSERHGHSGSGKSIIVASTGGNVSVPDYDKADVKVGINCYVKA